jgi:flagellar basal-body rod protein FlgB
MFIERLLNEGNSPILERVVQFTAARHRLIGENIVNISTPNYRQKDLSVDKFNQMLSDRIDQKRDAAPGTVDFSDVKSEVENPTAGILFHDGNNRSAEQLMSDQAKNAMTHNLAIELLRRQFSSLKAALAERVT